MMQTPFNSVFFTFCALILFLGKRNELAGASQQCLANPPDTNPCSGSGKVEKFGGLNCYLSGPADSKLAVVMFTDIFGFEAPHLRMVADKVGASGFYAVVPDFFAGSPYVSKDVTNYKEWIKAHPAEKGFEDAKPVVEALRGKGVTKIGGVGICWGAKAIVEFCKIPSIEAAVLMHPSSITVEDIKGVKVPMSILGAEIDDLSPPAKVKQFEEALNAKPELDHFVKIFHGCEHGWTIRYKDDNATAVENAEEAHKLMLDWLIKYVK